LIGDELRDIDLISDSSSKKKVLLINGIKRILENMGVE
jgi:hypothetical protein